jgi:hypothetical protein
VRNALFDGIVTFRSVRHLLRLRSKLRGVSADLCTHKDRYYGAGRVQPLVHLKKANVNQSVLYSMRLDAPVKKIALTYVPISLFLSHTLVVKWAYLIGAECTIHTRHAPQRTRNRMLRQHTNILDLTKIRYSRRDLKLSISGRMLRERLDSIAPSTFTWELGVSRWCRRQTFTRR